MTDTLTEVETAIVGKPVVVNASSAFELFTLLIRYTGTAGSFFIAMIGFARGRDLSGLFAYLQGEQIVPALSAVAGIGFVLWAVVRFLLNKRKLITAARAAPDSVAVVTK